MTQACVFVIARPGSVVHVGVRAGMTLQLGDVTAESASGHRLFESSTFGAYGVAGIGVHFW